MKCFRSKDGSGEPPSPGRNGERNFHKEQRTNETPASTSDPEARLYRKAAGRESRLCYMGHMTDARARSAKPSAGTTARRAPPGSPSTP